MTTELFHVYSVTPEFDGRKDVAFQWFIEDRAGKPSVPYADAITNYQAGDVYAEGSIEELFTKDEAELLVAYLDANYPSKQHIEPVALPIPNNMMGYGAIPVGGGTDFYMLAGCEGYDLPFKVWGYVDLRDSETAPMRANGGALRDEISF